MNHSNYVTSLWSSSHSSERCASYTGNESRWAWQKKVGWCLTVGKSNFLIFSVGGIQHDLTVLLWGGSIRKLKDVHLLCLSMLNTCGPRKVVWYLTTWKIARTPSNVQKFYWNCDSHVKLKTIQQGMYWKTSLVVMTNQNESSLVSWQDILVVPCPK